MAWQLPEVRGVKEDVCEPEWSSGAEIPGSERADQDGRLASHLPQRPPDHSRARQVPRPRRWMPPSRRLGVQLWAPQDLLQEWGQPSSNPPNLLG
ncbi:unnamed protein product [Gulo gulo]|uniref:Uncharacterized protein n=1 Tax=Gulo gulo TaxID=48420 RepID=A0A9X9LN48_GULGU|nr:unnamed protein product [Gulo gulo]